MRNVTSLRVTREPSRRDGACRSPTTTERWCGSIAAQCGARGSPSLEPSSTPPPASFREPSVTAPRFGNLPERAAENLTIRRIAYRNVRGSASPTSTAVRNRSCPARAIRLQSVVRRFHAAAWKRESLRFSVRQHRRGPSTRFRRFGRFDLCAQPRCKSTCELGELSMSRCPPKGETSESSIRRDTS